ncbi:uncharacterized protein BDZ99DRAFT_527830 [Mytilinidion resinicola]|uniref:Uncharacterized protein n=1 Tax=Mytilinidion resinicola TaxID=574789 RepID=A0A6A6Y304_9PEZI|nr:uncharacterized protein BDZ99DRAFT_527830 [Mytilinidion resinicola]KAF2802167.1 hypothetical protein BDZ99DRAFT_527830 [Mytilinidion resinicola]
MLLLVAKLCKAFGHTAQEKLFHVVDLDSRHTNGIFHRARLLLRTLVPRPDLRGKVKNLSIYLGRNLLTKTFPAEKTSRIYNQIEDPLDQGDINSIIEHMVDQHWGMVGGRSGPEAEEFRGRTRGSLGALFVLMPCVEGLEIISELVGQPPYLTLFRPFRVPLERIPAFANLRSLVIHQSMCSEIPWLDIESLTRLELSKISGQALKSFANNRVNPPMLSKIKHLSLKHDDDEFSGFPSIDIRSDVTVSYSDLLSYLSASHSSLETLTLVWPGRSFDPIDAYAITSLRPFKRLRHVEIEQMALFGYPFSRINKTWDAVNQVEVEMEEDALLGRMPDSLETLTVQGGYEKWESAEFPKEVGYILCRLGNIVNKACQENLNVENLKRLLDEDDTSSLCGEEEATPSLADDENGDDQSQECDGDVIFIDADFGLYGHEEGDEDDCPGSHCTKVDEPDEEYWQPGDSEYFEEEPDLIELPNEDGSANLQRVVLKVNTPIDEIPPEAMKLCEVYKWKYYGVDADFQCKY